MKYNLYKEIFVKPMGSLVFFSSLTALIASCGGGQGVDGADPGITDVPVAFVKRPLPLDNNNNPVQADLRDPDAFNPGANLYVKARASLSTTAVNITASLTQDDMGQAMGDVKDLDVSYDGKKVVFAMQLPDDDPNVGLDPTWNIWEYNFETKVLRRILTTDSIANQHHDVAPHYLPDNRIVFSSTRQRQSVGVRLDELKPGFSTTVENDRNRQAFNLHVMDPNGDNLKQISFNQSHDLDPTVLSNGQILFTRWDRNIGSNSMALYKMNPDGTGLEMVYGVHDNTSSGTNNAPIQYVQAKPMPNGQAMAMIMPFTNTYVNNGDINVINVIDYIDYTQPVWLYNNTLSGPAQSQATIFDIYTDGTISPGGRLSSAFPLWDGTSRMMISWSECKVTIITTEEQPCTAANTADPNAVEVPPRFGLWIYSYGDLNTPSDDTQLPIELAQTNVVFTELVAAQPRVPPPIIVDQIFDQTWITEQVGALHIRSVYDFGNNVFDPCNARNISAGCNLPTNPANIAQLADPAFAMPSDRPARFLRITKMVGIPDPNDPTFNAPNLDNSAFGPNANFGMREIIGYTRIEPDGSVKVKVPANVPLNVSMLDKDGKRIGPRHNFWLQVLPGETVNCTGCHTHNTANNAPPLPHGRTNAQAPSINAGASGIGAYFPNSVTTIFADAAGETMAEARTRLDPPALIPTTDIVFTDDWTAAAFTPEADFSFDYQGASGLTTAVPFAVPNKCAPWSSTCRIVINYEDHIDPLWQVVRADGPDNDTLPDTCIDCHTNVDVNNGNIPRVPDGNLQIDLDAKGGTAARIVSIDDPDVLKSYRELLFPDDAQELDMGGNLIDSVPANSLGPILSPNGALASNGFFTIFTTQDADPLVDHFGRLTAAELRLIAEWLDIGAQNFNDPFDAAVPVN